MCRVDLAVNMFVLASRSLGARERSNLYESPDWHCVTVAGTSLCLLSNKTARICLALAFLPGPRNAFHDSAASKMGGGSSKEKVAVADGNVDPSHRAALHHSRVDSALNLSSSLAPIVQRGAANLGARPLPSGVAARGPGARTAHDQGAPSPAPRANSGLRLVVLIS